MTRVHVMNGWHQLFLSKAHAKNLYKNVLVTFRKALCQPKWIKTRFAKDDETKKSKIKVNDTSKSSSSAIGKLENFY